MPEPSPLRGGAKVGKELQDLNNGLDADSKNKEGMLKKETDRLDDVKKESDANFKKLNDQNKNTRGKSRQRREAADKLRQENWKLNLKRAQQNYKLEKTSKDLSEELNKKTTKFGEDIKKQVGDYKNKLVNVINEETKKLENALNKLQESNVQLIKTVACKINELPNAIFDNGQVLKDCDSKAASS